MGFTARSPDLVKSRPRFRPTGLGRGGGGGLQRPITSPSPPRTRGGSHRGPPYTAEVGARLQQGTRGLAGGRGGGRPGPTRPGSARPGGGGPPGGSRTPRDGSARRGCGGGRGGCPSPAPGKGKGGVGAGGGGGGWMSGHSAPPSEAARPPRQV